MAFFDPQQLRPRRIEIDDAGPGADAEEIRRRLERIADSYRRLDEGLLDLEEKMAADPRFQALSEDSVEAIESEFGFRPRRRRQPKSAPRSNRGPRRTSPPDTDSGSHRPRQPR